MINFDIFKNFYSLIERNFSVNYIVFNAICISFNYYFLFTLVFIKISIKMLIILRRNVVFQDSIQNLNIHKKSRFGFSSELIRKNQQNSFNVTTGFFNLSFYIFISYDDSQKRVKKRILYSIERFQRTVNG